jgi:hypothetical protein
MQPPQPPQPPHESHLICMQKPCRIMRGTRYLVLLIFFQLVHMGDVRLEVDCTLSPSITVTKYRTLLLSLTRTSVRQNRTRGREYIAGSERGVRSGRKTLHHGCKLSKPSIVCTAAKTRLRSDLCIQPMNEPTNLHGCQQCEEGSYLGKVINRATSLVQINGTASGRPHSSFTVLPYIYTYTSSRTFRIMAAVVKEIALVTGGKATS